MWSDPEDPGFILLETAEERRAAHAVGLLRCPYVIVTRMVPYNAPCLGCIGVSKAFTRVPRDMARIKEMLVLMGLPVMGHT